MPKRLKPTGIADHSEFFIPTASYDLIDHLVKHYPQRCVLENETLESAHRYAGKVELVEELKSWKEQESES